jgi:hypothetical protein
MGDETRDDRDSSIGNSVIKVGIGTMTGMAMNLK